MKLPNHVRLAAFWISFFLLWGAWWLMLTERLPSWAWFALLPIFLAAVVLARSSKALYWLGCLSVLAMILLAIWLPCR
jgi:hypothetical protein